MSDFYIYDQSRVRIGVLQNYESAQWMENYQTPGEVKIDALATPANIAMLVDGNRVYNTDSDAVARISQVDITQSESEELITVRADITAKLLDDRVIMATEKVANVEASMYSIYQKNRRELPIEIASAQGFTERTDTQITWNSVLDGEEKLAEASGLGFKVIIDPITGAETFKVYKGVDRSKETNPGYTGYFGADVGNMQSISITSGTADFKNVAVVAGEGEGAARTVRIVSLGHVAGENRRELYVDARDLQREYQVAHTTGEHDENGNPIYQYDTKLYTNAEYNALLDTRGLEKLSECLKSFSVSCDVTQNNIIFGKDYFLGDRMPVKIPEYGIYASARITSVTRVYEKEGNKIIALLSDFELE